MSRVGPIRPARELKTDADDATRAPADVLDELASELNLLSQSHRTPEAFLERRDYLVKRIRRLAKRMRGEPPRRSPAPAPRAEYHRPPALPAQGRAKLSALPGHPIHRPERSILTLKGAHAARD